MDVDRVERRWALLSPTYPIHVPNPVINSQLSVYWFS